MIWKYVNVQERANAMVLLLEQKQAILRITALSVQINKLRCFWHGFALQYTFHKKGKRTDSLLSTASTGQSLESSAFRADAAGS